LAIASEIMWIPAHEGLEDNEIVDERARNAALNGAVFERPLPPVDFQGLGRSVLLREWQGKRDAADTGRFTHSILLNLMTWLSFFKDSWSNITSDLRWLGPVVQLEMPSLILTFSILLFLM
jgi:hypothetical protein